MIARMSTTLRRLESSVNDPRIGGFIIAFDTGLAKVCHWHATEGPIAPALDAAKHYTAVLIDALVRERREAELRDTNWVSVVAGVVALIGEFNRGWGPGAGVGFEDRGPPPMPGEVRSAEPEPQGKNRKAEKSGNPQLKPH